LPGIAGVALAGGNMASCADSPGRGRSAAAQEDSWQVISSYFEAKGLVRQQLVRGCCVAAAAVGVGRWCRML
jgi:hypothetical protein